MPLAERHATSIWQGDLPSGSGRVSVGSGALPEFPVTWASRTERSDGKTSPEELIAAAHASCFSMALSNGLAKSGHPADQLTVTANVTLDRVDGKTTITGIELSVEGRVSGVSADEFEAAAQEAGKDCPVSRALKGSVPIKVVSATLEQG
jgi:lipoyl-dependent peroxiredoxin